MRQMPRHFDRGRIRERSFAFRGRIGGTARCISTKRSLTHSLDLGEEGLAVKATRSCSICGAGGILVRGWCHKHYDRWLRHGDPEYLVPRPTLQERFWAKVNKDGPVPAHRPELGPCWVWTAATYVAGYGAFGIGGRAGGPKGAHVVSWTLANEAVPDGLFVLHHCDNRLCVRPDHLFVGTQKENIRDMLTKNRHPLTGAKGVANPNAKFTVAQIVDIRERFAANVPGHVLAAEFGVIPNTISRIVTGKAWRLAGGPLSSGGRYWRLGKGKAA